MFREMIQSFAKCAVLGASLMAITAGLWAASIPSGDWRIAGPFGGTATAVAVDPTNSKVLLAGAVDSLLFQSTDAGDTWNLLPFPKRNLSEVTTIVVDPSDGSHYLAGMVAADGGGMFESHDAGKSWMPVKEIHFGVRAIAVAPSQPTRFVAGTYHGVQLSDDSGKTWKRISDVENPEMAVVTAVAIDAKDPNIIYAGTSHLPWKTLDGGKTWTSIHTGMIDDSDVFSIYVDPAAPTTIFASACSGIYTSADRGDLWHKLMGIPNTSRRTHIIREDPASTGSIYAGTTMGLFMSPNRGTTWRNLTPTQVNWLTFDPAHAQSMYLALEYEGIGKSDNAGDNIKLINNGFVDRSISSVTVSGKSLVAIETQEGESTGIFTSHDQGESWTQARNTRGLSGVHLKAIAGSTDDDRLLIGASPHQIYKSLDAGLTWKATPIRLVITPPTPPETPAPKKPVTSKKTATSKTSAHSRSKIAVQARVVHPVKPKPIIREVSVSEVSGLYSIKQGTKLLFFAATDLGLLRSDDAAEHWTLLELPKSTAVTALYLSAKAGNTLIAKAANGLYLSKDSGDHWSELSFPLPTGDVNDIAVPPNSESPLLVATRVGLYASADEGAKWSTKMSGLPATNTVTSVVYIGGTGAAYAVEYGRLYETKDAAASWSEVSTSLPSLRIRQLWNAGTSSERLYAITTDLGIIFRN